jgi:hypothetical protein
VRGRGIIVNVGDRQCKESGVIVEFERPTKMEHKNETENDHFCEREGRVPFFKNENKNEIENELKMA